LLYGTVSGRSDRASARSVAERHKAAPVALDAGSINRASDRKVIMTVQNFLDAGALAAGLE
jgi:hypothetical protein